MGNFKIKSIWENKNTGGSNVPAGLENRVQDLETNAVKITGDQSIAGVKTFTNSGGEVIKLNSGTNNSAYIAGYKSGNNRIWYFGKGSSTSDEFVIGSTSNIKLEATNLNCNNKKLTNVADPAANQDAANKQYVDNRIKKRIEAVNINANNTYTINPTSGYQIVSVMVGRKRTSDGYYFFEFPTTLNKQVFLDNTTFKIYNQGNVSGFSNNEFKLVILEMKV